MARTARSLPIRHALAAACLLGVGLHAAAQDGARIVITGRGVEKAGIAGFGDMPLSRAPLSAASFGADQWADAGVATLGGLTRLDASVGGAYNAEGYWASLSARGYTLDNRFNYRRDGLPVNAETAIALDNKERLELLKGTSGIQAGSSAPGGLVNLVVKRPVGTLRQARIEAREPGSVLGAVDLGERFGADGRFGVRVNAAYEKLEGSARPARGHRSLLAVALDAQLSQTTLLEAEVESSRQRQPSAAGFSLLGNTVPDPKAIDPRLNLNHQPWGGPVQMDGGTASLRGVQRLGDNWRAVLHVMAQRLKSDDRTAFPYGVYEANYECPQWCDRFAPDGTFTYWQYESLGEQRNTTAVSFTLAGQARTAGVTHAIEVGALQSRYRARFNDQIFDIAGTGRIDGTLTTPPAPGFPDANTDRDERSTEFFARDAMQFGSGWQLWAGVRHTRLERQSRRTSPASDGLRATDYEKGATLPWLALSRDLGAGAIVYASWGQGLESDVAPNRARYINRGLPLPALKSRQIELGTKFERDTLSASAAAFDIDRPQASDIGACGAAETCTRAIDGSARHRGVEAAAAWAAGAWTLQGSAMWLDAKRRGAADAAVNAQRPVNVPARTLRLNAEYRLAAVPGLALWAAWTAESDRKVLPYNPSVAIPGWQRADAGVRWRQALDGQSLTWRLAVDNLADQRAWTESPYQFGHVYLYPLAPRTWRASLSAMF